MSAYVCNPEHIGLLAAYAVREDNAITEWKVRDKRNNVMEGDTAANVAKQLLLANIVSVRGRYTDTPVESLPGPCLNLEDQVLAVQAYARHYRDRFPKALKPVDILKAAQGYDYQSCEPDGWELTLAARQVRWIVSAAHRQLPGYEESDARGWTDENGLESVNALYNR